MRQVRIGEKWVNGTPTEAGQRFRFSDVDGWSYGTYQPDAYTAASMKITNLSFENRMTKDERKAIRRAALTDEDVQDFMGLAAKATHIDLSLQQTIDSVNSLEQMGLLGDGRAAQILYSPINDDERYRGEL
jgi:plasmid stability protein